MNKAYDRLMQQFNENPVQVLAVGALVTTAVAKLWQARNESLSRRIYAREVDRRIMKNR